MVLPECISAFAHHLQTDWLPHLLTRCRTVQSEQTCGSTGAHERRSAEAKERKSAGVPARKSARAQERKRAGAQEHRAQERGSVG
eukprot:1870577-Alexandrium_andersonii.AAC.1